MNWSGMWDFGSTASWTGAALASSALSKAAGTGTYHLSIYFLTANKNSLYRAHLHIRRDPALILFFYERGIDQ
jgi:hypothetical protein